MTTVAALIVGFHASCGNVTADHSANSDAHVDGSAGSAAGTSNMDAGHDLGTAEDGTSIVDSGIADADGAWDADAADAPSDSGPDGGIECKPAPQTPSEANCELCESAPYAGCHCAAEIQTCLNDSHCAAIVDCVKTGTGTPGPCDLVAASGASCVLDCSSLNTRGSAKYRAMQRCVRCNQCELACGATQFCAAMQVEPQDETRVAAGGSHTCARKNDGTLWCWGNNAGGQLGDGTTYNTTTPVSVSLLGPSLAMIAAGDSYTCAIKSDGTLWCWGGNAYGQLGDSTTTDKSLPIQVSVGMSSSFVAAAGGIGGGHTCAALVDGTLRCWGQGWFGQLGDGSDLSASLPVKVALSGDATAVAAGTHHSCARKSDGTLWCWGRNEYGHLGIGTNSFSEQLPVQVSSLGTSATAVATGRAHSCARTHGGVIWCWGSSWGGNVENVPVEMTYLGTNVLTVVTSNYHSCAIRPERTLYCWGSNSAGQLGVGSTSSGTPYPVQVAAVGSDVVSVATGSHHTCARKGDGTLWCWGQNSYGQLGNGTNQQSSVPVQVVGF